MMRERTLLNLAIGLILSILLHAYLMVWGPSLSLPGYTPPEVRELEVQLRDWPVTPPPLQRFEEQAKNEEPPAQKPVKIPQDKPLDPPDAEALQEALQEATASSRSEQVNVQLPPSPPPMKSPDPSADPVQIAQSLLDSLHREPRIPPLALIPPPPEPARVIADRKEPLPVPMLEHRPRQEAALTQPAVIPFPLPNHTARIKGPAAKRQVIFQPPPPPATIESETEVELRFWILPNGAVSRVIPLTKSDPRLEALAINYLRNWRFNPLPPDAESVEQWGIIPFKFRIR